METKLFKKIISLFWRIMMILGYLIIGNEAVYAEDNAELSTNKVSDITYFLNSEQKGQIEDSISSLREEYNNCFDISILIVHDKGSFTTSQAYLSDITDNIHSETPGIVVLYNTEEKKAYTGQYASKNGGVLLSQTDIENLQINCLSEQYVENSDAFTESINERMLPRISEIISEGDSDYKQLAIEQFNDISNAKAKQQKQEKDKMIFPLLLFCLFVFSLIFVCRYAFKRSEQRMKEKSEQEQRMYEMKQRGIERRRTIDAILCETGFYKAQDDCMKALFGTSEHNVTLHCSNTIASNFQYLDMQYRYLAKYFGLVVNDETVYHIDKLINAYNKSLNEINKQLGSAYGVDWNWPIKTFEYISPAGNASKRSCFVVDIEGLKFIKRQVQNTVEKQSNKQIQRTLMTPELRDAIIRRDNWTCQKCGNSVFKEPNLLLEVDHIIPVSKGGKTEPNNLQTLCWRCNREKSDKIDD